QQIGIDHVAACDRHARVRSTHHGVIMAFGKSAEEKEAERAERDRRRAEEARLESEKRAEAERAAAHARYLASPVGKATVARQQGLRFFEIQLVVSVTEGSTSWLAGDRSSTDAISHAETLASIEDVGWRLEHVGYVHITTGASSRDRSFSSGEQVAVSGQT